MGPHLADRGGTGSQKPAYDRRRRRDRRGGSHRSRGGHRAVCSDGRRRRCGRDRNDPRLGPGLLEGGRHRRARIRARDVGEILLRRRWALARDLLLALLVVATTAAVLGRVVDSQWSGVEAISSRTGASPSSASPASQPSSRSPGRSSSARAPARGLARRAAALGAVVLDLGGPSDVLAGLALGLGAGALVRLALGAAAGVPLSPGTRGARTLGVDAGNLTIAAGSGSAQPSTRRWTPTGAAEDPGARQGRPGHPAARSPLASPRLPPPAPQRARRAARAGGARSGGNAPCHAGGRPGTGGRLRRRRRRRRRGHRDPAAAHRPARARRSGRRGQRHAQRALAAGRSSARGRNRARPPQREQRARRRRGADAGRLLRGGARGAAILARPRRGRASGRMLRARRPGARTSRGSGGRLGRHRRPRAALSATRRADPASARPGARARGRAQGASGAGRGRQGAPKPELAPLRRVRHGTSC